MDEVAGRRVVVLTGAGCSTESGIPDYRGPDGRSSHEPIRYREFLDDPGARTRYWARSSVGWTRVAGSSLAVWSGFRFVERAGETGLPVAIVNLGETRGDEIARVRVHGRVGRVLPELADELLRPPGG